MMEENEEQLAAQLSDLRLRKGNYEGESFRLDSALRPLLHPRLSKRLCFSANYTVYHHAYPVLLFNDTQLHQRVTAHRGVQKKHTLTSQVILSACQGIVSFYYCGLLCNVSGRF